MDKKYYIGFDIGTESVGWATTDEEYNLLKARGQDFWGVYLFDEAKTAAARRGFRTMRRRYARRRQRIKLLQELFAEEISKVDFCFFERLNNSKYNVENKNGSVKHKDCLFHDADFNDSAYFKKYRTIYRLRADFLDEEKAKEITDVRLLYLAVAHIIKNRGHFLFEGQEFNVGNKVVARQALSNINGILNVFDENAVTFAPEKFDEALDVLLETKTTKSDKARRLKQCLDIGDDKTGFAILKTIVGLKVNVKDLFDDKESSIKNFCFDDAGFELEKLRENFDDDEYSLICEAKKVYDWAVLAQILGQYKYISEAMLAKYVQHQKDLELLKAYVKNDFGKEKYEEVFRNQEKIDNYAAYIGHDEKGNKSPHHAAKEDFYKYLRSFVTDDEIKRRMDKGIFLEKQRSSANAVIPYQLQLAELKTILDNASENFPFLNSESDGISVKDKILKLLTFRIPYYVGPLNTAHADKGFAWVKKFDGTEHERITPWNFDKIVDRQASETEFIKRMTNKCTYLVGEDVLPKQSLLYSEFAFLNELNNVTFKGRRLDKKAREAIVEYAKNNNRKITVKVLATVLAKEGLIEQSDKAVENFAGIDGEIKSSFSTLRFFRRLFGDNLDVDMCEEIVKWSTIMGNQADVANRAGREFNLDAEIVKQLKGLNCSGWGRVSKTFLDSDEITTVDDSGEILTIIQAMRETGCNLMELLSQQYGFKKAVDRFNAQNVEDGKVSYKTVEDLYCSPSVKRAIWRTVCLVREIEKVQKCPPARIFIEMARGGDKNKKERTKSRKEQLVELYKSCKADVRSWISQEEIADLAKQIDGADDARFLSDKLYLYYLQMGRCAYSGKPISMEQLFAKNVCNIDHIYPQSKIKDDSITNNRVLCFLENNQTKQDVYPVAQEIREKMYPIWSDWHKRNLISDEKFKRLTRSTPLTQEELGDFINRQLVETRQSTKAVAQILKQMYPNTDIVYSKASNVVDFKNKINDTKQQPQIVKVRELNDLHHAKDAYLNIVVGNVYYTKFNRNAVEYLKNNGIDSYNMKYLFDNTVKNAWMPSYKQKVVSIVNKNTCRVVSFVSEGEGKLFDATVMPMGKNDKLIPLKRNCPLEKTDKYGGYGSATTGYFALVKSYGKKDKIQLSLEAIPVYIDLLGKDKVQDYLVNNVGLKNPQILIEKIKINSLLKLNGAYFWLRGATGVQIKLCNANQLVLDHDSVCYLKKVVSFVDKEKKEGKPLIPTVELDGIAKDDNLRLYDALIDKMSNAPYSNVSSFALQTQFLNSKRNSFCELCEKDQIKVLLEVLHFLQCNPVLSNLKLIDGSPNSGSLRHSKNISQDEECLLITQSPTGYYKDTVNLTAYFDK